MLCANFALKCVTCTGGSCSLEHPQDRGCHPFPSIWQLEETAAIEKTPHPRQLTYQRLHIDQCMLGAGSQKPTTLSTNGWVSPVLSRARCVHEERHVAALTKGKEAGRFRTADSQTYPVLLSRELAKVHLPVIVTDSRERPVPWSDRPDASMGAAFLSCFPWRYAFPSVKGTAQVPVLERSLTLGERAWLNLTPSQGCSSPFAHKVRSARARLTLTVTSMSWEIYR